MYSTWTTRRCEVRETNNELCSLGRVIATAMAVVTVFVRSLGQSGAVGHRGSDEGVLGVVHRL